jgi:hypothetical protein
MSYSVNQSIAWAQSVMATYIPLTAQTGSEPALTIANMVLAFVLAPPFSWPTNRAEYSGAALNMTAGSQDYTLPITSFGFLETVTLTNPTGGKSFIVKNIYNSMALGTSTEQTARPSACSVKAIIPGTSVSLRFLSAPDLAYTGTATYQLAPNFFSATTQDWFTQGNIPQQQMHMYNNLFLAECFQTNGDPEAAGMYRRRGMAALLATAEGLTEAQKNLIVAQAMYADLQTIAMNLRAQMAGQARAV